MPLDDGFEMELVTYGLHSVTRTFAGPVEPIVASRIQRTVHETVY